MKDLEARIRTALQVEAATVRPRPGVLEENRQIRPLPGLFQPLVQSVT